MSTVKTFLDEPDDDPGSGPACFQKPNGKWDYERNGSHLWNSYDYNLRTDDNEAPYEGRHNDPSWQEWRDGRTLNAVRKLIGKAEGRES